MRPPRAHRRAPGSTSSCLALRWCSRASRSAIAYREFRARYAHLSLWTQLSAAAGPERLRGAVGGWWRAGRAVRGARRRVGEHFRHPGGGPAASDRDRRLLVSTALVLARETRSLPRAKARRRACSPPARAVLDADPRVTGVGDLLSLHLGPSHVLLAVTLDLQKMPDRRSLRATAEDLRKQIEVGQPIIQHVFFRPGHPPESSGGQTSANLTGFIRTDGAWLIRRKPPKLGTVADAD